jgi:hypothetical protein
MKCSSLIAAACAAQAAAEPSDTWQVNIQSYAQIEQVDDVCEYEVTIHNFHTDNVAFARGTLIFDGFQVGIAYELNAGPDAGERYEVDPPDGWVAIPRELFVLDEDKAVIRICRYLGF